MTNTVKGKKGFASVPTEDRFYPAAALEEWISEPAQKEKKKEKETKGEN
jgi:hypothetical protein